MNENSISHSCAGGLSPAKTALDAALQYTARGWSCVPIPLRSKFPVGKAWQKLRIGVDEVPKHFTAAPQNIGVLLGEPSKGLTDCDLDCPQALIIAPHFMPSTPAVFGRKSTPRSHLLYVCPEIEKTVQFKDPDESMLLELRSKGGQTVFPPSIHPEGESIQWVEQGEPLRISKDDLLRAAERTAAASLVAKHWPAKGGREGAAMALAGMLFKLIWTADEVAEFIRVVALAAGDEEAEKRAQAAYSTARRLDAGETVTAGTRLAELVGKDVVIKVKKWLRFRAATLTDEPAIAEKASTPTTNTDPVGVPESTEASAPQQPDEQPLADAPKTKLSTGDYLGMEHIPRGKQGHIQLVVHLDGAVFSDKLDVTDAEGREKFLKRLFERHPKLKSDQIKSDLDAIASEVVELALGRVDRGGPVDAEDLEDDGESGGDAVILIGIAKKPDVELFRAGSRHDAQAYATVEIEGHRETWPIGSTGFAHWLRRRFYVLCQRSPAAQAFGDAINQITSLALYDGKEHPVATRIAEHQGEIWLDLADDEWRAVRITAVVWELKSGKNIPVRFVRRRGMLPLPVPVKGGSIDELRPFVNTPTDELWVLYAGSLPSLFRPRGPFVIWVFSGPQDSAKSSSVRRTRALIDPNRAPLRRLSRDDRDLMIAAQNAFVLAFDNLSLIPPSISDALCSLATGGGFSTRQLYTDDEEKLFDSMRPVFMNGIEDVATRADLLDRCILLALPALPESKRLDEVELEKAFEVARPRILGALLDAASTALRRIEGIRLERKPRMLDFAKWCTAAEPSFGWKEGTFLAAYMRNRGDAHAIAMESSPVGAPLVALMQDRNRWEGTPGGLLKELVERHTDQQTRDRKDWPKTPKAMTDALKRVMPTLFAFGIDVEIGGRKSGGNRDRQVALTRLPTPAGTVASPVRDSQPANDCPYENAIGSAPMGGRDAWDGWDSRVPPYPKTPLHSGGDLDSDAPAPTHENGRSSKSEDESASKDEQKLRAAQDTKSTTGASSAADASQSEKQSGVLGKVGTRLSQASQPSRSGLGGPENAVSVGTVAGRSTVSASGHDRPVPPAPTQPCGTCCSTDAWHQRRDGSWECWGCTPADEVDAGASEQAVSVVARPTVAQLPNVNCPARTQPCETCRRLRFWRRSDSTGWHCGACYPTRLDPALLTWSCDASVPDPPDALPPRKRNPVKIRWDLEHTGGKESSDA